MFAAWPVHTLNMSARNIAITNYNIDIVTPDAKNREKEEEKQEKVKRA